jgi:hypothetical protein
MVSILAILLALCDCTTISLFDQHAYIQTTSAKVDALNTMDLARADYKTNEKSVLDLQTQLQKIYEYEKNRPKNEITLQLWNKLLDPGGHLLGGFLKRWETDKKLSDTFIIEMKKMVADAFDQIAGLESKKIKSSDVTI